MKGVLVIGGANADIKAKTLSPHVAATSNPAEIHVKPGGVARNIAHNLARLGVATDLLTVLGQDAHGEMIAKATSQAGVNMAHSIIAQASTGTYLAVLDENGELITAANDMKCLSFLSKSYLEQKWNIVKEKKYIIADCNLDIEILEEISTQSSDRLVIEPVSVSKCQKLLPLLQRHRIFLATPNLDQLEALTETRDVVTGIAALHRLGLQNIVVHAGPAGAYASDGQTIQHIASQAHKIVDVTGA
ncbi:MAG: carbohydrate kinase family protein, partial [Aestuariivirga sp.]